MPGRETMVALADYFGVSIDYLESGAQPAGRDLPADLPQQIDAREFIGAWEFLDEDQRRRLAQTLLDMLRANGKPAGHAERLLRSANRK